MMLLKKGNRNLSFRLLLLAGYLFLFATQINSRFYSVANFYVYGNNEQITADHQTNPDVASDKSGRLAVSCSHSQKGLHLSLDKRFQIKSIIQPSFPVAAVFLSERVVERKFHTFLIVYSAAHLPVNALRGPPCA